MLAGSVTLFLGVLLSDLAYQGSFEIQWKNFASWLLVGALVLAGVAIVFAIADLVRGPSRGRPLVYFLLLVTAWILGFFDALVHAKDAWASMPDAVILSVLAFALASIAAFVGFSTLRSRGLK